MDSEAVIYVCGGEREQLFSMDGLIAIGLGEAVVSHDGKEVYSEFECTRKHDEDEGEDWPPFWTGQDAENAALASPEGDWRIRIYGPLNGATWQRTEPGTWVRIESNRGFA